jgi:hypothetical protein
VSEKSSGSSQNPKQRAPIAFDEIEFPQHCTSRDLAVRWRVEQRCSTAWKQVCEPWEFLSHPTERWSLCAVFGTRQSLLAGVLPIWVPQDASCSLRSAKRMGMGHQVPDFSPMLRLMSYLYFKPLGSSTDASRT